MLPSSIYAQLGVGTDNPQQALHVNGQVRIDSVVEGTVADSVLVWSATDSTIRKVSAADLVSTDTGWNNKVYSTNISLNGMSISNDGNTEGITIDNSGNITTSGNAVITGNVSGVDVTASGNATITGDVSADDVVVTDSVSAATFSGTNISLSSPGAGDGTHKVLVWRSADQTLDTTDASSLNSTDTGWNNKVYSTNISLNGMSISNDGNTEGITIDNSGNITTSGNAVITGNVSGVDVTASGNATITGDVSADDVVVTDSVSAATFSGTNISLSSPGDGGTGDYLLSWNGTDQTIDTMNVSELTGGGIYGGDGSLQEDVAVDMGVFNIAFDDTALFVDGGNGKVGIGTDLPATELHVVGDITVEGNIVPATDSTGSIGTSSQRWEEMYATKGYFATSDVRLKKNITDMQYGLETVGQLRPVTYNWKTDADGEQRTLGFIAQELKEVLPEVVIGEATEDNYLAVNHSEMIAVLVSAIKELKAQNENLTANNTEMKAELEGIKATLDRLINTVSASK